MAVVTALIILAVDMQVVDSQVCLEFIRCLRHLIKLIDRGGYSVREQLPLPTKPPYTVHLGNMSFDATEGDISDFFSGCSVTSVRIVEDKLERKPKGFGYVEFASLEGLKKALDFNNTQFQGRNIRVSVAEPRKLKLLLRHILNDIRTYILQTFRKG